MSDPKLSALLMIPDQLFHYTKKETALEKILSEGKIRLGLFGNTNDPRETKWWNYRESKGSTDSMDELSMEIRLFPTMLRINTIRQNEWKILCLSQHDPKYNMGEKEKLDAAFPGYGHSRMWAQYAGNHAGICLEFNGHKLNENIKETLDDQHKILSGPVFYGDIESIPFRKFTSASKETIRQFFLQNYEAIFLQKTFEWQSEAEFRWMVFSKDTDPKYVPIDGAIESVIVGADFPKVYEPALVPLCRKFKIPARRIKWENGKPFLEGRPIYDPERE